MEWGSYLLIQALIELPFGLDSCPSSNYPPTSRKVVYQGSLWKMFSPKGLFDPDSHLGVFWFEPNLILKRPFASDSHLGV